MRKSEAEMDTLGRKFTLFERAERLVACYSEVKAMRRQGEVASLWFAEPNLHMRRICTGT